MSACFDQVKKNAPIVLIIEWKWLAYRVLLYLCNMQAYYHFDIIVRFKMASLIVTSLHNSLSGFILFIQFNKKNGTSDHRPENFLHKARSTLNEKRKRKEHTVHIFLHRTVNKQKGIFMPVSKTKF